MNADAPAQRETLIVIREYWDRRGHAPTLRELAQARGLKSSNGVAGTLDRLRKRGLVEWEPKRARTLRLTESGIKAARRWAAAYRNSLVRREVAL